VFGSSAVADMDRDGRLPEPAGASSAAAGGGEGAAVAPRVPA
jgi:hypothetical protein